MSRRQSEKSVGGGSPMGRKAPLEEVALGALFLLVGLAFSTGIQVHFTLSKLVALRFCAIPLVLLWAWRLKRGETSSLPTFVLICGLAMGGWWVFTTFFALHKPTALEGYHGRYNGLWTHLIFLGLFFVTASLAVDFARMRRILILFVAALVPVAAYAVIQYFQIDPIAWSSRDRAGSTIGHPVILAALLGLGMPFVLTFLLQEGRSAWRLVWGVVLLLFVLGAIATVSRGPWVGILVSSVIVVGAGLKARRIGFKRQAAVFLAVLCVAAGAFMFAGPGGVARILNRFEVSDLKRDPSVGGRMVYFRTAVDIIGDHPVVGVGFEHFRLVYPKYRLPEDELVFSNVIPTMVHNGYLQWAVTNGIPALALYLAFVASVLALLWRRCRRVEDSGARGLLVAFIAAIAGYLVQDLTGWLEIAFTTYFWCILGLAVACCAKASGTEAGAGVWGRRVGIVAATVGAVVLTCLGFDGLQKVEAERLFAACQSLDVRVQWPAIERNIAGALRAVPDDSGLEHRAAVLCISRMSRTRDAEAYRNGMEFLRRAHAHNPFDPYVLINVIEMDAFALEKGVIRKRSDFAIAATTAVLEMDRNNPTVHRVIAMLEQKERDGPSAPEEEAVVRLPAGAANRAYTAVKLGMKGNPAERPLRWTIVSGSLPSGMSLSPDGVVSGTPRSAGTHMFTAQAADGVSASFVQRFGIVVAP